MHCVHVLLKKNKQKTNKQKQKQTRKQTIFILSNSDPGVCSVSRYHTYFLFKLPNNRKLNNAL